MTPEIKTDTIDETRGTLIHHIELLAKYKSAAQGKVLQGADEICDQERRIIAMLIKILESQASTEALMNVNQKLGGALKFAPLQLVPKD